MSRPELGATRRVVSVALACAAIATAALATAGPAVARTHGCGRTVHKAYGVGYSGIRVSGMRCRAAYRVLRAYNATYHPRPYGYRIHWRGYTAHGHKGRRHFRASIFGVD